MDFIQKTEKKETKNKYDNENKNGYTLITHILNILHISILFIPLILFSLPNKIINKYFKKYLKIILLFYILVPLHWPFFNDACIFTRISINLGDYTDAQTTSQFSEENMMWLYKPIMNLFGWQLNNTDMNKITTLHSLINILLIWTLL